jgi:hypothetical protein
MRFPCVHDLLAYKQLCKRSTRVNNDITGADCDIISAMDIASLGVYYMEPISSNS